MDFLELRVPPLAQVAVFGLLMWAAATAMPALYFPLPGRVWLAGALAAAGAAFALGGVYAFRVAQTTVDPMHPETSSSLVTVGVYGWSRNPMYVGFFALLLGWAIMLSHGLAFALLPAFVLYMNRFQIVPEERCMSDSFGQQYEDYRRAVRRWL